MESVKTEMEEISKRNIKRMGRNFPGGQEGVEFKPRGSRRGGSDEG